MYDPAPTGRQRNPRLPTSACASSLSRSAVSELIRSCRSRTTPLNALERSSSAAIISTLLSSSCTSSCSTTSSRHLQLGLEPLRLQPSRLQLRVRAAQLITRLRHRAAARRRCVPPPLAAAPPPSARATWGSELSEVGGDEATGSAAPCRAEAAEATEETETEPSDDWSCPTLMRLSQRAVIMPRSVALPSASGRSSGLGTEVAPAKAARSKRSVPSLRSEPSRPSSTSVKAASFFSKLPSLRRKSVTMRARSCAVDAVRTRLPSCSTW
eukprot:scaffold84256_cov66-Phaeocystis_antarctica.AAC.3